MQLIKYIKSWGLDYWKEFMRFAFVTNCINRDLIIKDRSMFQSCTTELCLRKDSVWMLTGKRLGFIINFNVPLIKNGIKRFIL